jgi:acyl-ACP thioesterase
MKAVHSEIFRVRSYEVDPLGRLQVPILCKLLQEVAVTHAGMLGVAVETLLERGTAWVLSRMCLSLDRWPQGGDHITIETWPEAMSKLIVERRFALSTRDGDPIGTVSTWWIVLDLERRRPVRLPSEAWDRLREYEIGSKPVKAGSLAVPEPAERELAFTVRRSDVDLAGHANNTSFVEWAVEAVPDEVWRAGDLHELEIQFLAECHRGQTVLSRSQLVGDDATPEVRHQLVRQEDGVEVARARTVWRERLR